MSLSKKGVIMTDPTRAIEAPRPSGVSSYISIGTPISSTPPAPPTNGQPLVKGNFKYDFDRDGWVLREDLVARADLPVLIMVGADDYYFNCIDGLVSTVIDGTADPFTKAFFATVGTAETPKDGWGRRPEQYRDGAVVVLDFQYYQISEGAATIQDRTGQRPISGIEGIDNAIASDNFWWGTTKMLIAIQFIKNSINGTGKSAIN
jgi:hypothetical protein